MSETIMHLGDLVAALNAGELGAEDRYTVPISQVLTDVAYDLVGYPGEGPIVFDDGEMVTWVDDEEGWVEGHIGDLSGGEPGAWGEVLAVTDEAARDVDRDIWRLYGAEHRVMSLLYSDIGESVDMFALPGSPFWTVFWESGRGNTPDWLGIYATAESAIQGVSDIGEHILSELSDHMRAELDGELETVRALMRRDGRKGRGMYGGSPV